MKKILLATTCLVAFIAPAAAADLPARVYTKAPAQVLEVSSYNWTGFYLGGHIGAGWRDNGNSNARFLGGLQGGADYQFSQNWVMGIEANYSFLARNTSNGRVFGTGGLVSTESSSGLGSVTGRLGYAWGPALLYAKGGYAFRDNSNTSVTVLGVPVAFTVDRRADGYTIGGGLEYMFAPNWSGKLEYQYYDFGNTSFTSGPAALVALSSRQNQQHTIKAGINYRFNWGGRTVTAAY